ncbi:MAG TPA: alpha-E domain-containing protein [Blastocatellia bacterium]|nr:alpha-E domain-containing protein [Blastocatellia bacterium]
MLSRVADALYWMSRYVERAENITRILTVNFHTLLDARIEDTQQAWQPIIAITGDDAPFRQSFDEYNARHVSEFLLWHAANPNAVTTCITLARENARSVREQISSEMWEHLNRLYFLVRDLNREITARGPYEFFDQIRHGSQAFQGITSETMTHGEAYEFIQLGKHLERADKTVRILDVKYAAVNTLREGPETSVQLLAMLRSCSAFEAFRKTQASQLQAARVAEFLLLNQEFPRAVAYCLQRGLRSVNTISSDAARQGHLLTNPQRTLGRVCSELDYLDIGEVLDHNMHPYLDQLLLRLNQMGDEITRTYFNTQVILPSRYPQQAQQSQQQQ